jgi:riboflavin biosynthesis pyrimidine reductase
MAVIASLVVGSNGATTLRGESRGLSTPADRERFLARHRSAAAFIIGKNSARVENYSGCEVPIFVLTRSFQPLTLTHPTMQQINVFPESDIAEITRRIDERVDGDIVVEAGAQLLISLIKVGVIDLLELSITPIEGDDCFIDIDSLISHFTEIKRREVDGTQLLECRNEGYSTNSEKNS